MTKAGIGREAAGKGAAAHPWARRRQPWAKRPWARRPLAKPLAAAALIERSSTAPANEPRRPSPSIGRRQRSSR
ncbi:hypothetical protein PMC2000_19710 [Burkholderia pseudomallei]|uniref:Uncharacterized protein n=1 Tax=Burkholderia pseudomallei TaxID=28450 RepID=A0AAX0U7F5_BURPE|nr:hypothetical protein CXQ84_37065 [Burkholderia pseudomallei]MUU86386.1 hypothetical protein [Burkholderia pseudomallei]PJO64105.1 hypothetical protein CWD88_21920 [Burkholderia pseudomallei]PPF06936.1 hypothetical protein B9D88_012155 [Burkholderia pseudomallei]QGS80872.1 hypothetical protein PMC2000_19710 [Burkholderia pseudomallei]